AQPLAGAPANLAHEILSGLGRRTCTATPLSSGVAQQKFLADGIHCLPRRIIAGSSNSYLIKRGLYLLSEQSWRKEVNRKLIRPSLTELKEQATTTATVNNNGNSSSGNARPQQRKKPVPPEQTNAENFYYVKQMQSKTPMVIVMLDG